jgi:hypothetical protein
LCSSAIRRIHLSGLTDIHPPQNFATPYFSCFFFSLLPYVIA